MKRLEKTVYRKPEQWVWSHNRWKYSYEYVRSLYPDQEIIKLRVKG